MQTFQVNSHINENGILSVKLPKEWAEKDVNVVLDLEPGSGRGNGIAPVPPPTPPAMRFSATAIESGSLCCREFRWHI